VRTLKTSGLYEDGGGLRLVVSETGAKRWVMRLSVRLRRHQLGLGSYPEVSLERAREAAAELRKAAREGRNIIAERRARKQGATTFRQAFDAFFELKKPTLANEKHAAQWKSTVAAHVFPVIGNRPVADITADEIIQVLKPIWHRVPETAKRVLQRIEAVFKSAILRGTRERASPCIGIAQELGVRHRQVEHHRAMPYDDLPAFVARLREKMSPSRLALEFLVLTAARSGEVRHATWSEIVHREWVVPATRMKARRQHVVPLCDCALALLQDARRLHPTSELIFPGAREGAALSDMTLTKVLRDMGLAGSTTVHGFRSAFRDWATEVAKAREVVAEAALAHTVRDKTEAAYRRATYLEERRELMENWAWFLSCSNAIRSE